MLRRVAPFLFAELCWRLEDLSLIVQWVDGGGPWQRWIGISFESAAGFATPASPSLNQDPQTGHVKGGTADTAHCRRAALG